MPAAQEGRQAFAAEKFLIQFGRVLLKKYKIIILDELTDSLTMSEVDIIYKKIEELKQRGTSIVYITHRIDEAVKIADVIGVLKDGELNALIPTKDATNELITNKMLGKDIKQHYPKLDVQKGEIVLQAHNISNKFLHDVSFSLRRGEVLGIAGLVGSGRTSLLKAIVGLAELDNGKIELNHRGKDKVCHIGYMPESRDSQGLFEEFSVAQNITIKRLDRISKMDWISPAKEEEAGEDMMYRLGIKARNVNQKVLYLSGGNKQKTLVARSVFSKCNIYVFDEPTKGVDTAGKVEVYNIINDLIRKGAAVMIVSSDFSELAGMCDNVLVIRKGTVVAELTRRDLTQQNLFLLCKE
jgi:ribose transport system ATP-binding protein